MAPFHANLRMVPVPPGNAESTDGVHWVPHVIHEEVVAHTGLSEIRYGTWQSMAGGAIPAVLLRERSPREDRTTGTRDFLAWQAPRLALVMILLVFVAGCTGVPEGVQPVTGFEVERYLGTWYEIARLVEQARGLGFPVETLIRVSHAGPVLSSRGRIPAGPN